jgi:hypothetical protein
MALPSGNTYLKRLRNHYRLIIMNEDTFEEMVAFKLTRWTVYLALSAFFIVLVGLTIALVAFTPLKLYIPGYGVSGNTKELENLKLKADSIERQLIIKQQYIRDIENVLKGNVVPLDTTQLKMDDERIELIPKKQGKTKR